MNNSRPQDLSKAFSSIISMMLMAIRARGWRWCLLHLPEIWRTERDLRQMGEEFAALVADFRAGVFTPPPPAPLPDPPEPEAEYAWSPPAPRPAARPNPAPRTRRAPAIHRPRPAADAGPDHQRTAESAPPLLHVWPNPGMRAIRSRRAPGPTAFPGVPTVATGRSP